MSKEYHSSQKWFVQYFWWTILKCLLVYRLKLEQQTGNERLDLVQN